MKAFEDYKKKHVKLHENYWTENELKDVRIYLPKRKSTQGRPPSIGTIDVESRFEWPSTIEYVGDKIKAKLMGLAIERAVVISLITSHILSVAKYTCKRVAGQSGQG